mmetsp:Transcript_135423/g.377213  ORF Transcript_135423/g.377213 Transcript_135423/m.377213 type:complete len:276 (-) Transcript_135423:447-1274(-)
MQAETCMWMKELCSMSLASRLASCGCRIILVVFRFVDPLNPFPLRPKSQHRRAVHMVIPALTVLLPIEPIAIVPPVVGPREDAKARLPVICILSAIDPSIGPRVNPTTVDHAALPLPLELALVGAEVCAGAAYVVASPATMVRGAAVGPAVNAQAVFLSIPELTLVLASLFPSLNTIAVLQVIDPLASVASDQLVVRLVVVDAHAMSDIVMPLAAVDVTISVNEPSSSFGTILSPLPFIDRPIVPPLHPSPMPRVAAPLPRVSTAAAELVRWPLL